MCPPPRLPFWVYNIRPVVGKTRKNSTVRNKSKNHHRRRGDEVEMTNEQIQRGTRTVRRSENGGNEWVTEIRRDK